MEQEAYLRFKMQIYISRDEWEIVNTVYPRGNPSFADMLKEQDNVGNIDRLMHDPWHFLAHYFHLNFCGWENDFEDKQLDRNDEVTHRERVLSRAAKGA